MVYLGVGSATAQERRAAGKLIKIAVAFDGLDPLELRV